MKIVVLNECFLSPTQLDYLASLGELTVFNDTTSASLAMERIKGAEIILADMFECPLTPDVLQSSPDLKLLCLNTTTYEKIDLDAARKDNVLIGNIPDYGTVAVAEQAFALILALARKIIPLHEALQNGAIAYIDPASQEQKKFLGFNLQGKTIGIIGLGAIGAHIAKIALGFDMNVIAHSRSPKSIPGVTMVSLDALLAQSDIISLSVNKAAGTENVINEASLSKMKRGSILINNGFSGSVDLSAVVKAMDNGQLGALGIDSYDGAVNTQLLNRDNVILTPHAAWFAQESLDNIARIMIETVKAYVEGKPINIVS